MIISVVNQKGGVGKTTTAATVAHGMALKGYQVLLVDLDSQGHLSLIFGVDKSHGLHQLLVEQVSLEYVTTRIRDNLDLVSSDKSTEGIKRVIAQSYYPTRCISIALQNYTQDLVILDTAPSLDILQIAAIQAADWLLIPTRLDALALDGVNEILRTTAELDRHGDAHIIDYSILPTYFERITKETHFQLRELSEVFAGHVWPPIPLDTKVREASAYGQSLWEYCVTSPAIQGINGSGGYVHTINLIERML